MKWYALASILVLSCCLIRSASAEDWTYGSAVYVGSGACVDGSCGWGFGCCQYPAPRHDHLWSSYCADRARLWSWWHARHHRHCGPSCGHACGIPHAQSGVAYR